MHGHKIKIVECPYCVYACQYVQKLQRHLLLVHKLTMLSRSAADSLINGDSKAGKRKFRKQSEMIEYARAIASNSILDNDSDQNFEKGTACLSKQRARVTNWCLIIPVGDDEQSVNDIDFEMNFNEYEDSYQQEYGNGSEGMWTQVQDSTGNQ